jgi:hypothetical protein
VPVTRNVHGRTPDAEGASGSCRTPPPHQGLLSAKIANAIFLSADRGLDSSAFPSRGGSELIFLARYARHSAQGATQRIDSTDQFLTLEIFSAKLPP